MTLRTSMAEALRLTRAGDISGATALLRSAASGAHRLSPAPLLARQVIDLGPEAEIGAGCSNRSPAGQFVARRHAGPAGELAYMLYIPSHARPGLPLVVMLHGCTQTPEDFARGTRMNGLAEEMGFLVAYPRQTQQANPQRCWNWFRPADQARGHGEPARIAGIVQDVIRDEGVDASRVFAAGLSAGGAAAAILADAYPDLFAAIGVHSGLMCGAARNLPGALSAMKQGPRTTRRRGARFVPVITFHGDNDSVLHEANAGAIIQSATEAAHFPVVFDKVTGTENGRRYTCAQGRDASGRVLIEQWTIDGGGHAWSGGDPTGSYADANGPDASRAMVQFLQRHVNSAPGA